MFTLYSADFINAPSNCSYGNGYPSKPNKAHRASAFVAEALLHN